MPPCPLRAAAATLAASEDSIGKCEQFEAIAAQVPVFRILAAG